MRIAQQVIRDMVCRMVYPEKDAFLASSPTLRTWSLRYCGRSHRAESNIHNERKRTYAFGPRHTCADVRFGR
ncbi:hypothetical protein OKW41_002664 [Paraburkholderia sp. UCT70]